MQHNAEELVGQPYEEYHSADDAMAAWDALSSEERSKLARVARIIAGSSGFPSPDDLINEAYIRIADGRRRWPQAHTFVSFVAGVMKSLRTDRIFVSDERRVVGLEQGFAIVTSEDLELVAANDDEMTLLLMGVQEGLIGKDLQDVVGVEAKRLEALRTRLKRRVDNLADEYRSKEGLA